MRARVRGSRRLAGPGDGAMAAVAIGGFWLPEAATAPLGQSFLGYEILTAEERAVLKRLRRSHRGLARRGAFTGIQARSALRRRRAALDALAIADLKRLAQLMLALGL